MLFCSTATTNPFLYLTTGTTTSGMQNATTSAYTSSQLAAQAQLALYLQQQQAMQGMNPYPVGDIIREVVPTILSLGQSANIELPDGGRFVFLPDGAYRIEDRAAKVIYRANRVREFNTYVNASDRLEDFVRWAGALGLTAEEVLRLPIRDFIQWLVTEAGLQDGCARAEDLSQLRIVFRKHVQPRCQCGRLIPRRDAERGFFFCSGAHYDRYRKLRGRGR